MGEDTPQPPPVEQGGQKPSVARRWMRRALKAVMWLLVFVVFVVLAALVWLQTDHGKGVARDVALDLLNSEFQGRFEVARIEGSIIGDVTLVGVKIYAPDGTVALDAERVSTDVHLLELLSNHVHLSEIRVLGPRVILFDATQQNTFEQAFLPTTPSPSDPDEAAWDVVLDEIHLQSATVDVNMLGQPLELTQTDVKVGRMSVDAQGGLGWSNVVVTTESPAPYPTPVRLTAEGAQLGDNLSLGTTTIVAGPHRVTIKGEVVLSDVAGANVVVSDLVVDLDQLPSVVPPLPLGGLATGSGRLEKSGETLTAEFELITSVGRVLLKGNADLVADPPTYAGSVAFFDLRPGGLALELADGDVPKSFMAQGTVAINGVGNPLGGGSLTVDGHVVELAPTPGSRLRFSVASQTRSDRILVPGQLALFDVSVRARGLDVGPWLPLAGLKGLGASLNRLDLAGSLVLSAEAAPALNLQGDLSLTAAGRLEGVDEMVDVPELTGRVDLVWPGVGLPTGLMLLDGVDLRMGQRTVGQLGLDLQVDHIDDAYAVSGVINVSDVVPDVGVSIGHAQVPVDLKFAEALDTLPSGQIGVSASAVEVADARVGRFDGNFKVRGAETGLRVDGPFEATAVRTAAGGARRVDGRYDGWVGFNGGMEGEAKVTVEDARAMDVKVQRLELTAAIEARRGLGREPTFRGSFSVVDVDAAGMRVRGTKGTYDLQVSGAFIEGTVKGAAQRLTIEGRDIDRVAYEAGIEANGQIDFKVAGADGPMRLDVLGSALLPVAGAERIDLQIDVLTLALTATRVGNRRVPGETLIAAKNLHWQDGRWVEIDDLAVSVRGANGRQRLIVNGRVDPTRGLMDLRLIAKDVRLRRWLSTMSEVLEMNLPLFPGVDGIISAEVVAKGTFEDPELNLTLGLREGQLDELNGMTALVTSRVAGRSVSAALGVGWHAGGKLEARVDLPVKISLSPFKLEWDEAREMDVQVNAEESDLSVLQSWLAGFGAKAGKTLREGVLAGSARLNARLRGPVSSPFGTIEAGADNLTVGRFANGTFALRATSHSGQSQVVAQLKDAKGQLLDLQTLLPLDSRELLTAPSIFQFVRDRLRAEESELSLKIDRRELRDTPMMVFLPADFELVELAADLKVSGKMVDPDIDGRLSLSAFEYLGLDGGVALTFDTLAQALRVGLVGTARDRPIVEAFAEVPEIGILLTDFAAFSQVLYDPRTHLEFFTAELSAPELWDFSPSIGELATNFFPDGMATIFVRGRGAPKGPVANVAARVRVPRFSATQSGLVDRNLAEQVWLNARLDDTGAQLHLNMQQRSEANAAFQTTVKVPIGSGALVEGTLGDIQALAIDGKIVAEEFRLDGLAAGLRTVLGPSRGNLRGEVALGGTVGAPRLEGSLDAWFRELTVSPVGLHRNELNIVMLFEGDAISIIPVRFDAEPSTRAIALAGKEEVEPAFMEMRFGVEFPSLDPAEITFDGAVEMADFPLFDRDDLRGRMKADIALTGTAARPSIRGRAEVLELLVKPEFGGRTIRPLGLPADVTLVSGAPTPPAVIGIATSPFKTAADINIEVIIPEGTTQALGDLFDISPHGKVVARTVEGELGLYGTVFAPKVGLNLYGRKFLLSEDSRVIFSGDMRSDPALRVTATYDISEVDLSPLGLETGRDSVVRVQVTGDVNNIRLELSSEPPMDEANIISVIVLGTPVESGGATQGDAFRSQVANMVIGIATGGLRRLLTDQLPIDVFELDTEDGDLSRSRLTVGKRLARNLLIRYRANLGAQLDTESVSEVAAEFKVGDFTIIGNYGDIGEFSVEASLRFRARLRQAPERKKRKDKPKPAPEPSAVP